MILAIYGKKGVQTILNKEVSKLREKIKTLPEDYGKCNDIDDCDRCLYEVIYLAAEIYKNALPVFFMPMAEGKIKVYQIEDGLYIPLYTDSENAKDEDMEELKQISLQEVCGYITESQNMYALLPYPKFVNNAWYYSRITDYTKNNPWYRGIVLDPNTDHAFIIAGWIKQAIVFIGNGCEYLLRE